ncbi:MAG TPA: hypothetical protein VG675_02915 [Bryobacteraceae bacterium]|nr:hypothetical protein [Bryobacteraceae bacterium]
MRHHLEIILSGVLAGLFVMSGSADLGAGELWRTTGRWHRFLKEAIPGTLLIEQDAVEFRSEKFKRRWAYIDIRTVDLSRHEITLMSYENRPWHEPGERRYHFSFTTPIPEAVAAQLTVRVRKPVRSRVPVATDTAILTIPAHLGGFFGGSNGALRLKDTGIDYLAEHSRDSRSWRWTDIQTIANPDALHLRITAYRGILEFDLKQPLPRTVFERLWDHLYANGLNLSSTKGADQ